MTAHLGPVAMIPGRAARRLLPLIAPLLADARRRGVRLDPEVLEAVRDLEAVARADRERQAARGLGMARASDDAEIALPMLDAGAEMAGRCERMNASQASTLLGLSTRRLRQVGAAGDLGAVQDAGGLWTFAGDQVRTEAALRQKREAG